MESDVEDIIKNRLIEFNELHPDPDQAGTAALLLADLDGVMVVETQSPHLLKIRYNVLEITLEHIEAILIETGFHISTRLICALKRALYYYTEETQRTNCGCPKGETNCTRKVFVNRYQRRDHELRDHRPEHWRKYL